MLQRYLYNISETPTYWIFLSCPVQPVLSLWNVPRTVLETVGDSKLGQSIDLRGETKRNHPLPFSVHHPFSETDILQVTYSNALIYSDIEFQSLSDTILFILMSFENFNYFHHHLFSLYSFPTSTLLHPTATTLLFLSMSSFSHFLYFAQSLHPTPTLPYCQQLSSCSDCYFT